MVLFYRPSFILLTTLYSASRWCVSPYSLLNFFFSLFIAAQPCMPPYCWLALCATPLLVDTAGHCYVCPPYYWSVLFAASLLVSGEVPPLLLFSGLCLLSSSHCCVPPFWQSVKNCPLTADQWRRAPLVAGNWGSAPLLLVKGAVLPCFWLVQCPLTSGQWSSAPLLLVSGAVPLCSNVLQTCGRCKYFKAFNFYIYRILYYFTSVHSPKWLKMSLIKIVF